MAKVTDSPPRFSHFRRRAEQLLENPGRVGVVLKQVRDKLPSLGGGRLGQLAQDLKVVLDLVAAWFSGEYRQVSNKTIVILLAALLYFVTPLDLIPDFLFGWGLLDDAVVLTYVVTLLQGELQNFRQWQKAKEQS